jgi:molecular chaperone DnaK
LAETKNQADNLIYVAEKTLRDAGEKISESLKKEVQNKIEELKKVKEGDNIEDIKNKIQELSQTIQKIGMEMYKGPEGPKETGGPEEGEYREK